MEQLQQLDRIDRVLAHPAFRRIEKESRKWQKLLPHEEGMDFQQVQDTVCQQFPDKCQAFMQWMSKKEEWDRLQERKAQLEALKKRYKKLRGVYEAARSTQDIRQLLKNPETLRKIPGLTTYTRLLSRVQQFQIGSCFPEYDPLSLSGTRINGLDVGYNLKGGFIQTTVGGLGQLLMPVRLNDTLWAHAGVESGKLLGIKGGPGKMDDSHLYVSALMTAQGKQKQPDFFQRFIPLQKPSDRIRCSAFSLE